MLWEHYINLFPIYDDTSASLFGLFFPIYFCVFLFKILDIEKKLLYYTLAITILSLFVFRSYYFVNNHYKIKSDLPRDEIINFHEDKFLQKMVLAVHSGEFF